MQKNAILPFSPATADSTESFSLPLKRATTLYALARAVAAGELRLHPGADVGAIIEKLSFISGIGDWTAKYIAMRALRWPDAFPGSDLSLRKALGENGPIPAAQVLRLAKKRRPWRAYAAVCLWSLLAGQRKKAG